MDKMCSAIGFTKTTESSLSHTTTPFAMLIKTDSNLLRSRVNSSIFCSSYICNLLDISLKALKSSLISPEASLYSKIVPNLPPDMAFTP